jgi:hypothetical protein
VWPWDYGGIVPHNNLVVKLEAGVPVDVEMVNILYDNDDDEERALLMEKDDVPTLVKLAMDDPMQETDVGRVAQSRLRKMASANGWTEEQMDNATGWGQVGDMALNPLPRMSSATCISGEVL